MINIGDIELGNVIRIPFNTFDSDGASVTVTNLANTDVHIHKDGSVDEFINFGAITVYIDFDGITGCHIIEIDTGDSSSVADFEEGFDYKVRLEGITVDTQTLNPWIGMFSIRNRTTGSGPTAAQVRIEMDDNSTKLAAIVADTNEIQGKLPANKFMGSSDGADDDGTLNTIAGDVANIDGSAMVGTNGANTTTPPTVGEIQAEMEANGASLLDTIRDAIENGTYGLSALETLVDEIETLLKNGTYGLSALRTRGDAAWITGGGALTEILNIQDLIPNSIDLANTATVRLALGLTNMLDNMPSTAEIDPGTISIDRKAIGGTSWTNIVNNAACSEVDGMVYYDEVFNTGTGYAAGDSIRITFKNQKITVDANDYEVTGSNGWIFQTFIREAMVGTNSAATAAKLTAYIQLLARKDAAINSDNSTELSEINASGGSGGGSFDNQTDAEQAIRDAIVAASPQSHLAEGDNITTGTRDGATTYTNTLTINTTYFQTSPVSPAVGGFGLNTDLTFTVGTGLNRVPNSVNIVGYLDSGGQRKVHVWAYNYLTSSWNQLSDNGSSMSNESSNKDYQHSLQNAHIQTSDGEVKIRFTSTSTTVADDLYLDFVSVNSIAVEAAGLTADAIADSVASHDVSIHTDHDSFGFRASQSVIESYDITTSDTSSSFTCSGLPAITNYYQAHKVRIHDITNSRYADSWILSMDNSGVVILGRALPFTPDTSAEMYITGSTLTLAEINAEVDAALSDYGANTTVPDVAGTAAGLHSTTNEKVDDNTTILDKLDPMITEDSAGNEFTTEALANAPTGSGGDATLAKQNTILSRIGTPADIDGGGADLSNNIKKIVDDNAGATFDAANHSLWALRTRGDSAWITGGGGAITDILNIERVIPNSVDLANTATVRLGLGLTNMVDDLPSAAEIDPGTISIDRKARGGTSWTSILNDAACSEVAGLIYYDEVFDTGTGYAEGDSIRITFKNQKITVSANDYEITGSDGWTFQTYIREAGTTAAEVVTTLMADTGFTTGGTMTFAELMRIIAAWNSGNWRNKPGSTTIRELLDADDSSTVVLRMTLSETTPFRTITII